MNDIYKKLLKKINEDKESFNVLVESDNTLGLNVSAEEIINYLEFNNLEKTLPGPIVGNILLTEGDILSVLKIIHDLEEGEYTLYINNFNEATITYLVSKANEIYKEIPKNIQINLDYSKNYNAYLNELVTLIGSEDFVNTAKVDFPNANQIIV